jgi:hypothetical protein
MNQTERQVTALERIAEALEALCLLMAAEEPPASPLANVLTHEGPLELR